MQEKRNSEVECLRMMHYFVDLLFGVFFTPPTKKKSYFSFCLISNRQDNKISQAKTKVFRSRRVKVNLPTVISRPPLHCTLAHLWSDLALPPLSSVSVARDTHASRTRTKSELECTQQEREKGEGDIFLRFFQPSFLLSLQVRFLGVGSDTGPPARFGPVVAWFCCSPVPSQYARECS